MADPTELELTQQAERERIARESEIEMKLAAADRAANPPVVIPDHVADQSASFSLEPGTTPPGWKPQEEPTSAVDRLRAFEDEHFGKDAVRINGRVERGSGSRYQALPEPKRRHYQALEKLVEADEKLVAAHAALMTADAAHEAAMEDVARAENEADAVAEQ